MSKKESKENKSIKKESEILLLSTVEIVLDAREAYVKKELEAKGVEFTIEQLFVGDILFRDKNSKKVYLICERKTATDMYSSIINGRYAEQRERLKQSKVKICYILESYTEKMRGSNTGNVISGALENLVLYHNIYILPTVNVTQTAKVVLSIAQKLEKKPISGTNNDGSGAAENPALVAIMTQRKDKMMQHMLEHQLMLIPGVSPGIAKVISEKFPTVRSLLQTYDSLQTEQERFNLLADISLGKKKLGKVLSKRIATVYLQTEV